MKPPKYPSIIAAIRPYAQWSFVGSDYSGLLWLDAELTQPTQEECDAAWPQVEYELAYREVQQERRIRYIEETDGLFFAAQRDGGDLTAWTAAVDAIKADLPYPVAP
jgi:hypothetical protein